MVFASSSSTRHSVPKNVGLNLYPIGYILDTTTTNREMNPAAVTIARSPQQTNELDEVLQALIFESITSAFELSKD